MNKKAFTGLLIFSSLASFDGFANAAIVDINISGLIGPVYINQTTIAYKRKHSLLQDIGFVSGVNASLSFSYDSLGAGDMIIDGVYASYPLSSVNFKIYGDDINFLNQFSQIVVFNGRGNGESDSLSITFGGNFSYGGRNYSVGGAYVATDDDGLSFNNASAPDAASFYRLINNLDNHYLFVAEDDYSSAPLLGLNFSIAGFSGNIPEPSTLWLLGAGIVAFPIVRRLPRK